YAGAGSQIIEPTCSIVDPDTAAHVTPPRLGKTEFVVRDQSLLSGFNNPLRSCRNRSAGLRYAVPADRLLVTVAQNCLGARSACLLSTNPITSTTAQIP